MLHLRTCAVGLVAVLLVGAAGCSSPPQTETNLKTGTIVINPRGVIPMTHYAQRGV